MRDQILRFLEPIRRSISLLIGRAVITAIKDTGAIQSATVEVLEGESREVLRYQNYGLSSNPPIDSEAVIIFQGGNRAMGLMVCCDHRSSRKKNLEEGETALYTKFGDFLLLDKNSNMKGKAKKFQFQGETDELLTLIESFLTEEIDLADKLSKDTTNTIFGPMQLNGFAYYAARKAALQTIKTKLTAMKV